MCVCVHVSCVHVCVCELCGVEIKRCSVKQILILRMVAENILAVCELEKLYPKDILEVHELCTYF